MPIHKLTARQVEAFKRDGVFGDGGGLYLRVRGDARHWLFIFSRDGRRREMGLGSLPAVSLAKARERAQVAREQLSDGQDPIDQKRAGQGVPTFGEVADNWMLERQGSVRSSKSIDRWHRALGSGGYADGLRRMRVDRVGTKEVLAVLQPVWSKGPTATLVRGYIEAVLDAAKVKQQRSGENPARWKGHLDQVLPRPKTLVRGHHAALPYLDAPSFMARLRDQSGVVARLVEFTVLTASRAGAAAGAKWEEVDLDGAVWTVPSSRMKAGREHRVPLCSRAVSILRELLRGTDGGDYVFGVVGGPTSNMAGPMLLRRLECGGTLHGFRSTFRDFAGDMTDHPHEIAEAALAHTPGTVERAYRRSDALERRRQLMIDWSDYCSGVEVRQAARLPR